MSGRGMAGLPGYWTCHICRRTRPDAFISVLSKPVASLPGLTENIRYCNDRPECEKGAKAFSFMKKEDPHAA